MKDTLLKRKEQRIAVLIDAQNMYHSAKHLYGARVNFKSVLKDAVAGRKLIRAVAYVIHTEGEEEKNFFEALRSMGIEVKTKELQIFPGGMKKADWDVGITVDAIKFSDLYDSIVLISGDGDFVHLVNYIKNAKPARVEVVAFRRSTSGKLIEAADDFLDLEKNPKKYLINKQ
jgi:uncharacterized LabA/DUF88 family protein